MKGIVIHRGQIGFRDNLPPPTPRPGEIVVDVRSAGICETDLQLARGYMGFEGIPGHEFVGVAKSGRFAGCRVVGEINCNCGQCDLCQQGLGNHCPHRTVIGIDRHDGAFAQQVCVPEQNLHVVPDSMSDDRAVLVEPLAAAWRILQQVDLDSTDRVAVIGDGRMAYFCAHVLATRALSIVIIGKHPEKLTRFPSSRFDSCTLDDLPARNSFDVVVDCTGSATGLPLAIEMVRPCGTIVMKTTVADDHRMSLAPIVINEINVIGSRCGPFDQALASLDQGNIPVDGLITHRFGLNQVKAAMDAAMGNDAFKVVFQVAQ